MNYALVITVIVNNSIISRYVRTNIHTCGLLGLLTGGKTILLRLLPSTDWVCVCLCVCVLVCVCACVVTMSSLATCIEQIANSLWINQLCVAWAHLPSWVAPPTHSDLPVPIPTGGREGSLLTTRWRSLWTTGSEYWMSIWKVHLVFAQEPDGVQEVRRKSVGNCCSQFLPFISLL